MKAEDKLLLQKFLEGHCSEEELVQVGLLLGQPGAHELLDELITLQSGEQWHAAFEPDQELLDLTARKKAEAAKRFAVGRHEKQTVKRLNILRYAAMWAGLILVGMLALWQYEKSVRRKNEQVVYVERVNPKGLPVRYVLPDSSVVFLGAGSKLSYPAHFRDGIRDIRLEGEAFFEVTHHSKQPFIIRTGDIHTQVLGTSFKVTAFDGVPLEVAVATGKVGVSDNKGSKSRELAKLTPGMKIRYDSRTDQTSLGKVDVYSLENWKAGDLSFEEQPISAIVQDFQRRFDVKIDFADKEVAGNRVSVTFPANKPIGSMMHILSETGRFSYESTDSRSFKIYKYK